MTTPMDMAWSVVYRSAWRVGMVLTAAFGCHEARAAISILDTGGFETYSIGALEGHFAGSGTWQQLSTRGGTANVQATVGLGGSRGVRVDRGASSNDWWAVNYSGLGFPSSSNFVVVDWDMKVNATGAADDVYGPFLGVDSYDDSNDLASPKLLGSLGVDATTGDVLYQEAVTGSLTETGVVVDTNWHHYQLRLNFAANEYSASVDYVSVTPQPIGFVDGASNVFTDADIAALAAAANHSSQIQTGTAFFDNFVVHDGLQGDYNNDGLVNLADYTVWRDNLGAISESPIHNNGDGLAGVDMGDYTVWSNNFSASPTAAAAGAAAAVVPEPSSLALVGLLAGAIVVRTRACADSMNRTR